MASTSSSSSTSAASSSPRLRVFVTGASGFIGSAVVRELVGAGHRVLCLARTDTSAAALHKSGADVVRGDLSDTDTLAKAVRECDGVAHLGFVHDFSTPDGFPKGCALDQKAISTMLAAVEGTQKPVVISSGTLMIAGTTPGRAGVETDPAATFGIAAVRGPAERLVVDAAAKGVRGVVIRLSPTVHGAGDHGFVPNLISTARTKGFAAYVGDGQTRWPTVHRLDAARLYRLALEKAAAPAAAVAAAATAAGAAAAAGPAGAAGPGPILHAVHEEGVTQRAIAEAIGAGLGVPVRSITNDEAAAHFGFLGALVSLDAPVSSAITRSTLGWTPEQPGLIADLSTPASGYFKAPEAPVEHKA